MEMPLITQIDEPLAEETWDAPIPSGGVRRFRMLLGAPVRLDESYAGGFWYCACAVGFDDALEFSRFGGPGRLSALINACKWLDSRRWQLVDEPLLIEMDSRADKNSRDA